MNEFCIEFKADNKRKLFLSFLFFLVFFICLAFIFRDFTESIIELAGWPLFIVDFILPPFFCMAISRFYLLETHTITIANNVMRYTNPKGRETTINLSEVSVLKCIRFKSDSDLYLIGFSHNNNLFTLKSIHKQRHEISAFIDKVLDNKSFDKEEKHGDTIYTNIR